MNEKDKEFDKKQQILSWFTYLAIFIFCATGWGLILRAIYLASN